MKKRILIVDDEAIICESLSEGFAEHGFETFSTDSVEDALEIIKKESIQIVFIDLNLEENGERNGIDLCKLIKGNAPLSCLFAMTGYYSLFQLSECMAAGFEDYFRKPTPFSALLEAANYAFHKIERWRAGGKCLESA